MIAAATAGTKQRFQFITCGAGIGLIVSLMLSRVMQSLLYDVDARDPVVLGFSTGIIVLVAIVAALLPAIRPRLVDSMMALQSE